MEFALKISERDLKLLTDVNMIFDFENSIRRGIKKSIFHYAEVNN